MHQNRGTAISSLPASTPNGITEWKAQTAKTNSAMVAHSSIIWVSASVLPARFSIKRNGDQAATVKDRFVSDMLYRLLQPTSMLQHEVLSIAAGLIICSPCIRQRSIM